MRVRLSYTVNEEEVLGEAAKLLGLCTDDMKDIVNLFNDVQFELQGQENGNAEKGSSPVNTVRVMEMLQEFRQQLSNIDTRVFEVLEVVDGYQNYLHSKKAAAPVDAPAPAGAEEKAPIE